MIQYTGTICNFVFLKSQLCNVQFCSPLFQGMANIDVVRNCSKLLHEIAKDTAPPTAVPCHNTQESILTKYSFAIEGVSLSTVAVVGIFANLLSIAVLRERTMKTQITALLITLAIFDTIFLFCCIPVFGISSIRQFVTYLNDCIYHGEEGKKGLNDILLAYFSPLCLIKLSV